MFDLLKMAIVLLYPDGSIESIPITTYSTHMPYFKEHLHKSKRFQ